MIYIGVEERNIGKYLNFPYRKGRMNKSKDVYRHPVKMFVRRCVRLQEGDSCKNISGRIFYIQNGRL